MKVFLDPWGTPISFRRFANLRDHGNSRTTLAALQNNNGMGGYITELSNPPYSRLNANRDALDPEAKLSANWFTTGVRNTMFNGRLYDNFATGVAGAIVGPFPNLNLGPFIFSAGPDKKYHSDTIAGGASLEGNFRSTANDDIVSYRLRRTGERGD